MNRLIERAEAIARVQQRLALATLAETLRSEVRGARVEVEATRLTISGRGLLRRWLVEPALRLMMGTVR